MYKFTNKTTKEDFLKAITENGNTLTQIESNKWLITSKYGNKWTVVFTSVNQFTIFNYEEPFWVDIYIKGQDIEILQAGASGKKFKSERYLKKFNELSMLISCYFQFNYLKVA